MQKDIAFLNQAEELALKSQEEVGCGAIIVKQGKIIAKEFNSQTQDKLAINHGEIKVIVTASSILKSRSLSDCVAYCSYEPCASA
ncbi:MAG TPA: deaminase [Candidatus Saccharimonadales bacterium]|nr:deaminase [Candidatus Saccharimonadales bacterium]